MSGIRPYQQQAVDALLAAWSEGKRGALIVMPTGTGKTRVFAAIAEKIRPEGRVLVLAHREELIDQAEGRFEDWTDLRTSIEMAEQRADLSADVVIASVQSLVRRLPRYPPDHFRLVVVDEAHHTVAPTYRQILRHFQAALVLGVTATPDRADNEALGQVYDCAPFIMELRDAIEQGWLTPIRQLAIRIDSVDLRDVRTTAGDLNESDLEDVMLRPANLHGLAEPTAKHAGERRTLVFATTVRHAEFLARALATYVGDSKVRWVAGEQPRDERRAIVDGFRRGDFQFLLNCMIATEGFDVPEIACVVIGRPTKSRALYCQMIGRSTRLHPDDPAPLTGRSERKPDALVLDFKGNAGRHKLVNVLDVLDGNRDAAAAERAQALMNAQPVPAHIALQLAAQQLAEEARARLLAELRARRERELQHPALITPATVRHRVTEIDPFAVLGVRPRAGRWGGRAITERQAEVLKSAGLPTDGLDRGQASELIEALVARRKAGLCTVKQARLLASFGLDPDVPFQVAREQLDRIEANGWVVPRDLVETARRAAAS